MTSYKEQNPYHVKRLHGGPVSDKPGGNDRKAQDASPYRLLLYGLDSLYVSYDVDLATSQLDFDQLAYEKERLRQSSDDYKRITLGSECFALMAYGRYPYRYVLSNRDFEIAMAERMHPSVHVTFRSEALWTQGLEALDQRLKRWFPSIGATVMKPELVSRADWAFDFDLAVIDFDEDCFVSRAAKDSQHREHGKVQTFTFGRNDVVIRVYDKAAEIAQESGKYWFYDLWGQRGGVWRIEFQVRKDRLQKGGIRCLGDLCDLQYDLLRELANNHTTLRTPTSDSNRARWPLHPLWRGLTDLIASKPQTGLVAEVPPHAAMVTRLDRQLKSVYGALKGIGAAVSIASGFKEPISLDELMERLPDLLGHHHSKTVWRNDLDKRMQQHRLGQW